MKAIIETFRDQGLRQRAELIEEYRLALREWSRARWCNPSSDQAPEVLAATQRIEKLEQAFRNAACEQYSATVDGSSAS